MNENHQQYWYRIKVYDQKSETYTYLDHFGDPDSIVEQIDSEGLWQYVSMYLDPNQ